MIVVTLLYTADPLKRSEGWVAEARAGMKPGAFEQEFLIDYDAKSGEKVFPQIIHRKERIIVPPGSITFPESQVLYGGFDYGKRNPSSFHVYTWYDQILYSIYELYEPAPNIPLFAAKILDCPYYPRIRFIAADGHIFSETSHQDGIACSISQHFINAGVKKLVRGDTSQRGAASWQASMHTHWEAEEPTFKIFASCPQQIREFGGAVFTNQTDAQLQTSNYKEGIVDNDNHSLDDCKYLMLSLPGKPPSSGRPKGWNLTNRW
jgi:hypothetical protein